MAGRVLTTNTKERLVASVEDVPIWPDPDKPAQQQLPIATRITAAAGSVANPRAVTLFTEVESKRWHKVKSYMETAGDVVKWVWECEAQRAQ